MSDRLSATVKRLQGSPCKACTQEKNCENKHCLLWRSWFLREWKKFNNYYEKHKEDHK